MKKIIKFGLLTVILFAIIVFLINFYVVISTKNKIIKNEKNPNVDCILVLGAGVWNGRPSPMLKDRLDKAISLYKDGVAPKLLMSGDHGKESYDEVNAMKEYAINSGVKSEDIFMDHAGFSTYDSIYRAKNIFSVKKVLIVTQRYHLYRAIYIAKSLGLEAYGSYAKLVKYSGRTNREAREVIARNKDFFKSIIKPKSKYLGEVIPVSGDGNITNDKPLNI